MTLSWGARTTLVAGLLVALLFLFLGVRELRSAPRLTNKASQPATVAARPVASVAVFAVATRAIDTGETITAAMVRNTAADPTRFPNIATPPEVVGKVATQPILAGAMIARTNVDLTTKLAIRVPIGMRAMSIDTTAEIAVAGLVRPGDRVDVQVIYPGADAINGTRGDGESRAQTLLQMVQVLAVGDLVVGTPSASAAQGAMSSPPPAARTVTLALSPDQVSSLSLAKATGSLYLSLRNPADNQQVAVVPVQSSAPVRRAAAQPAASSALMPRAAVRSAPPSIDLVVGERHEVIYPGNTTP